MPLTSPSTTATYRYNRGVFVFLSALFGVRLVYLFLFPHGFVGDESYYWEWGRRLAWGYYSKPPLIGWLMGLSRLLGADTAATLRLPALLMGTSSLGLLYLLSARLFGDRAGFWSVVLLALNPGNTALNLMMTIDAPVLFFWSLALLCYWETFFGENKGRAGWSLLLIVALGLGYLSKQIMWGFPFLGLVHLFLQAEKRRWFLSPWLWLGLLASYAFLLPTVLWNSHHNWIMFQHTAHHIDPSFGSFLKRSGVFFEFVGSQLGIVSPVTFAFVGMALVVFGKTFKRQPPTVQFLWLFSAPGLLGFFCLALLQRVYPNWPAPFYTAGIILGTVWILSTPNAHRWLNRTAVVGGALVVLLYSLPFLTNACGLDGSKVDLFIRFRGWNQYAAKLERIRDRLPRPEMTDFVVVGHRYHVCNLSFYSPRKPYALRWEDPHDVVFTQYELWPGVPTRSKRDALIVAIGQNDFYSPDLWSRYEKVVPLGKFTISFKGGKNRHYHVYFAKGWD